MIDFIKNLLTFSGRLNRKAYWLRILKLFALIIVGMTIGLVLSIATAPFFGGAIMIVAVITGIIASLGISVRRLHDRNKSGWWLIPFQFLPNGLLNMSENAKEPSVAAITLLPGISLSIWGFVEIGCLKGTEGDNLYGPDPLQNTDS